jgi:hypothetical protein
VKRSIWPALWALVLLMAAARPVAAERAIVDPHTLDAYFSLFAANSNVPWKPTTIRLQTYTGSPVNFAAYAIDAADVITAGSAGRPRTIDTARMHPVAQWQFTPQGGYQFQSSDVDVPLGTREGFFVIEARRGSVGEQVWIDRTRVGLIAKATAGGLLLYVTDLGTGRALANARVQFVVGTRFVTRYSDANGIVHWSGAQRPIFALAQWGQSQSFLSLLPQAPLPATIVGVRVDSAVAHAGDVLHVIGFARTRTAGGLKASSGNAVVSIRLGPTVIVQKNVKLDPAGAFATGIDLPGDAKSGDYAVLAQVDGATGGAAIRVDANAAGLALSAVARCGQACDPSLDVPLVVRAIRSGHGVGGISVHVDVVRSPHAFADDDPSAPPPWGITDWLDTTVITGNDGTALIAIAHPTDGLASTYGIHLEGAGATAQTRVVVPTSSLALQLHLNQTNAMAGAAVEFRLFAQDIATGKPASNLDATVIEEHGEDRTALDVTTDENGVARGSLAPPPLGTTVVLAQATLDGATAADAAQVQIVPQTNTATAGDGDADVGIALDRNAYRIDDTANVSASDPGAAGDALLTIENAVGITSTVVDVASAAKASFALRSAPGSFAIGAAFVRDGAIEWNVADVPIDGPGRPSELAMTLDRPSYPPGKTALVTLDANGAATVAVRLSRGTPSGSARFESAADQLAIGIGTTQDSAPAVANWHPSVDSAGRSQTVDFEQRSDGATTPVLAESDTQAVYWHVERLVGAIAVPMPRAGGTYILSVLRIGDDGRIAASSSNVVVR